MRRLASALPLIIVAASCDIPTSTPSWEGTWELAEHSIALHPEDLLPEGIVVTDNGSSFRLEGAGARDELTLGDHCAACRDADGSVTVKPAFSLEHGFPLYFPGMVQQASVVGGEALVTLRNHLPFDPIRPGSGAEGALEVAIVGTAGGAHTVSDLRLDGADAALPPGRAVSATMNLRERTVRPRLEGRVSLDSPEGDSVWMAAGDGLSVELSLLDLEMDEVGLRTGQETFPIEPFQVESGMLADDIRGRVTEGQLQLDIANPFEADLALSLRIRGDTDDDAVTGAALLEPGRTATGLELSGPEARRLLRSEVLTVDGTVQQAQQTGPLMVTPERSLEMDANLTVEVGFGGGP